MCGVCVFSGQKNLGPSHGRVWTSIGRVLKNSHFWGVRSLREPHKNIRQYLVHVWCVCVTWPAGNRFLLNKIKSWQLPNISGTIQMEESSNLYFSCMDMAYVWENTHTQNSGKSQDSSILKGEPLWWFNVWMPTKTCWWFQPIWKILVKMGIFPK